MKISVPHKNSPAGKKALKDLTRVLLVGLFFVASAWLLKNNFVRQEFVDLPTLRDEIDNNGVGGKLMFVCAVALINALGIPRIWICALAGSLLGAVEGGLVGIGASMIGSMINFLMGRSMLRGPVKRNMPKRLRKWYKALDTHGFRVILYLRLFPFTNSTLTNLVGGASHMKVRDYFFATLIGYLPLTIAFATLGSSAAKQSTWQLILGLGIFAIVILGQWIWKLLTREEYVPVPDMDSGQEDTPPGTPVFEAQLHRKAEL